MGSTVVVGTLRKLASGGVASDMGRLVVWDMVVSWFRVPPRLAVGHSVRVRPLVYSCSTQVERARALGAQTREMQQLETESRRQVRGMVVVGLNDHVADREPKNTNNGKIWEGGGTLMCIKRMTSG